MSTRGTFNLSKTEFTAYLECPLKFYLMKQQNLFTKKDLEDCVPIFTIPLQLARVFIGIIN